MSLRVSPDGVSPRRARSLTWDIRSADGSYTDPVNGHAGLPAHMDAS
jgi:hypothetical protein